MQQHSLESHVIRKVAWRLIPFLGVLYFFAFLDRVNVGFAALTMNADLGLSSAAYGIGAGIFFLGYVLFEVPSNLLLERYGARIWIARILVSWGLCSAAMAFVQGPWSFYAVRLLLGFAEAGFFPGIIYYLTCWFPSAYRARIIALFLLALPLSSVIGAPVSTALLGLDMGGIAGWRWMFLFEALPTIVLGFVVLKVMTDRPAQAHWLTAEEREWLCQACDREAAHGHTSSLMQALALPRVWLQGLTYFGLIFGVYGFGFFLPQIIKSLGTNSNFQVGLLTMVPYALTCVAMVLWGRHSDATGERSWHIAASALFGAVALFASGLVSNPVYAFAALSFAAVGIYSGLPSFWALVGKGLKGPAAAGTIAVINSIGNLGGFFGPSLIGMAKERTGTYTSSLLLIAIFLVAASVLVVWMRGSEARAAASAA